MYLCSLYFEHVFRNSKYFILGDRNSKGSFTSYIDQSLHIINHLSTCWHYWWGDSFHTESPKEEALLLTMVSNLKSKYKREKVFQWAVFEGCTNRAWSIGHWSDQSISENLPKWHFLTHAWNLKNFGLNDFIWSGTRIVFSELYS